jgi:arginine exporter protein ArgO
LPAVKGMYVLRAPILAKPLKEKAFRSHPHHQTQPLNRWRVSHGAGHNRPRDRHPTAPDDTLRPGGRLASTADAKDSASAPQGGTTDRIQGDVPGGRSDRSAVTGALVAGLLAGYGVAVPVGAIGALIVGLTARTSLKVGACAALGVATADGIYAVIAVLGGAAIARVIEPIATPLRWSAALILVVMAVRTAYTAIRHHRAATVAAGTGLSTPGRAYLGLLGLTLLNPATIVYFGALVLGRQAFSDPLRDAVWVLAAFLASASWQLLLAAGADHPVRAEPR